MDTALLHELLEFAVNAAWQAGRITLGYFHAELAPDIKPDNTPVTIADRQSEEKLRQLIGRYWPEHGIIGEEFGVQTGTSDLTWILDPIDGTKSFIHGVPLYAVLVALVENGKPLLGIAHFPALNETVYAARGEGCYWDGRRCRVSQVADMSKALLLTSDIEGYALSGKVDTWQRLMAATALQRTWGDAYGYALVATGRAEVMVDPAMMIWDCGPLGVILEEAGGTFTDWNGVPTIDGGNGIATNGVLFDQVMQLVR